MASMIDDLNKPLELIAPLPLESEFDLSFAADPATCDTGVACSKGTIKE